MGIKYVVDVENKAVTAYLAECENDAINRIDKDIKKLGNIFTLNTLPRKYLMSPRYSGTVKCHKDDDFNEDIGIKLAKEKLMKNYYKGMDNRLAMFADEYGFKLSVMIHCLETDYNII